MVKIPKSAQQLSAAARNRTGYALERALDRVFDEPFDVPDAETATQLLTGPARPSASALLRFIEGQALVKIGAQVARLASRSKAASAAARVAAIPAASAEAGAAVGAGGAAASAATSVGTAALAAAAVTAATRTTRTVSRGLTDVRVLASYLASRARKQHVVLDKPLLRALTLAAYTDPRRHVDFRLAGSRGATSVATRWARETLNAPSDARRREDAAAWIAAIDRLDLVGLAAQWERH
jgi:hypothetical protein